MRLATVMADGGLRAAVVRDGRMLPLATGDPALDSVRGIAAGGRDGLKRVCAWVDRQPETSWTSLDGVELGPAVPDPGAVYAIGLNYVAPGEAGPGCRPERPLVYAKLPSSVTGHRSVVTWDRSLTANVDAEAELAVVIGNTAVAVAPDEAMEHVFGYTCIDDISSRDAWLDGDQWLLGKSLAGFCPVGPWVVTRDEIDPANLALGCHIDGVPIQDGNTCQMRFPVAELVAYLSRHVTLHAGDLIATGTPARLEGPLGPERHLEPGDVVTVWIEGIGELMNSIA